MEQPIDCSAGVPAPRVLLQTINDSSILACGTTEASSASCCCDSDVLVNFYITAASDAEARGLTSAFTRASLGANNSFATCLQQVGVCSAPDVYCQDTWPSELHRLCTLAAAAPTCALSCKIWSNEACVAIVTSNAHIRAWCLQESSILVDCAAIISAPGQAVCCSKPVRQSARCYLEQKAEACIPFSSSL